MVEEILGKQVADDIYNASRITALMTEKQAEEVAALIEKDAFSLKDLVTALKTVGKGTVAAGTGVLDLIKAAPKSIGYLAMAGAGTGALGGAAWNTLSGSMAKEDPREKLNARIESMYAIKKRELEDAKWMDKVRSMRDELKRGYKKMSVEEYSKKYNDLVAALDERKA